MYIVIKSQEFSFVLFLLLLVVEFLSILAPSPSTPHHTTKSLPIAREHPKLACHQVSGRVGGSVAKHSSASNVSMIIIRWHFLYEILVKMYAYYRKITGRIINMYKEYIMFKHTAILNYILVLILWRGKEFTICVYILRMIYYFFISSSKIF